MNYATTAAFVARFTEREAIALTDRDGIGRVDEVQLAGAIAQASSEVDTYLGKRYALPLAKDGVPLLQAATPLVLVGLCCDIARYRLTGTEVQETEAIRTRYKDAIALLAKLGSGEATFAEGLDLVAANAPQAGGGTIRANERERLFDSGSLGTY